jgi:hypothetical protein
VIRHRIHLVVINSSVVGLISISTFAIALNISAVIAQANKHAGRVSFSGPLGRTVRAHLAEKFLDLFCVRALELDGVEVASW